MHPTELAGPVAEQMAELAVDGSIELIEASTKPIHPGQDLLPYLTSVFVPAMAKRPLMSNLDRLRALCSAGYNPVPHLAARRLESAEQLREFLSIAVVEAKVQRVLLIAGDEQTPVGPFVDTLAILDSGILEECGIHEVSFAGYPEGHSLISHQGLQSSLEYKLDWARKAGVGVSVVTQFCFAPVRIIQFCTTLEKEAPGVPVYVGLAGPTSVTTLFQYARMCGVSTSLRALKDLGIKAAQLAMHTDPSEQLQMLAHHCLTHHSNNIIGVHVFSFGGFTESARWMHDVIAGASNTVNVTS